MNAMAFVCLLVGCILLLFLMLFSFLKEDKAIKLIAGFNSLTEIEQKQYDLTKICSDVKRNTLLWLSILFVGAFLSYFFSEYFGIIAMLIWYLLMIHNMGLDSYEKYKK